MPQKSGWKWIKINTKSIRIIFKKVRVWIADWVDKKIGWFWKRTRGWLIAKPLWGGNHSPSPYLTHAREFPEAQRVNEGQGWGKNGWTVKARELIVNRYNQVLGKHLKKHKHLPDFFKKHVSSVFFPFKIKTFSLAASPPDDWKKQNMGEYATVQYRRVHGHGVAAWCKRSRTKMRDKFKPC